MTTATLNNDGSIDFYQYMPDGTLGLTHHDPAMVQELTSMVADWVKENMYQGQSLIASCVIYANLAVQEGLITAAQLKTWSAGVTVRDIFTGTPTQGGATYTESFQTAISDPNLTTNSGAPTVDQAQAIADLNLGGTTPTNPNGPTFTANHSAAFDQVQCAYIAYYGRPADPDGSDYWISQLQASGGKLDSIMSSFGNSAESQALYGGMSVSQMLDKIYHQEFNRAPDAAGAAYWTTEISSGRVTAASAALTIFNGAVGIDQKIINNKLVVADSFSDILAGNATANALYAGNTAVHNARDYLSAVTADTALAAKLAGIGDSVALHIQGSITADLSSVGVVLVGQGVEALF